MTRYQTRHYYNVLPHKVLHRDKGWMLYKGPEAPRFPWNHWLGHYCSVNRATHFRYLGNIDTPCEECGSVCPDGMQGMFRMLEFL